MCKTSLPPSAIPLSPALQPGPAERSRMEPSGAQRSPAQALHAAWGTLGATVGGTGICAMPGSGRKRSRLHLLLLQSSFTLLPPGFSSSLSTSCTGEHL